MKSCHYIFVAFILFVAIGKIAAQGTVPPTPSPIAKITASDGSVAERAPGDEDFSGEAYDKFMEAPLRVEFFANAEEEAGFSMVCSWDFTREGEAYPFLTRYDEDVNYEFRESGTIIIQPKIIYTSTANPDIVWEFEFDPIRIVIAESSIDVPNAFSPNGDGINDYYNVYNVKSIVEFNAAIYNRWGQQLYSWGIDQMECEECGWDGTYKGKPVKDGVYFVVVTARGADGIEYEVRRDVNVLRGYVDNVENP